MRRDKYQKQGAFLPTHIEKFRSCIGELSLWYNKLLKTRTLTSSKNDGCLALSFIFGKRRRYEIRLKNPDI
jgi:hypothetical protein